MFRIEKNEKTVKWDNFVWSDGYPESEEEPDDSINIEPLIFDKVEYEIAMATLKKLINEK